MGVEERVANAISHLKSGKELILYRHAEKPESIYENPDLYPGMFPWLYPFGRGGFQPAKTTVHRKRVDRRRHIQYLLQYYDHVSRKTSTSASLHLIRNK